MKYHPIPPKIYVFLNFIEHAGEPNQVSVYVAASEDGYGLALEPIKPGEESSIRFKFGENSLWAQHYRMHYPAGYKLVFIENINAPEHAELLQKIRQRSMDKIIEKHKQDLN